MLQITSIRSWALSPHLVPAGVASQDKLLGHFGFPFNPGEWRMEVSKRHRWPYHRKSVMTILSSSGISCDHIESFRRLSVSRNPDMPTSFVSSAQRHKM